MRTHVMGVSFGQEDSRPRSQRVTRAQPDAGNEFVYVLSDRHGLTIDATRDPIALLAASPHVEMPHIVLTDRSSEQITATARAALAGRRNATVADAVGAIASAAFVFGATIAHPAAGMSPQTLVSYISERTRPKRGLLWFIGRALIVIVGGIALATVFLAILLLRV